MDLRSRLTQSSISERKFPILLENDEGRLGSTGRKWERRKTFILAETTQDKDNYEYRLDDTNLT